MGRQEQLTIDGHVVATTEVDHSERKTSLFLHEVPIARARLEQMGQQVLSTSALITDKMPELTEK